MPKKIEEQLAKLDNPDDVKRLQLLWNEYVAANDNYELTYPQQFANQVDGNRRFGEQKSIPTPAEQLRMYETMLLAEIDDLLQEQDKTHEATYELEDDTPEHPTMGKLKDFQVSSRDMSKTQSPGNDKRTKGRDVDQSQELGVTWLKTYQQQKQVGQEVDPEPLEQPKQGYDFKLIFNNLDEVDRDAIGMEPEERQKEDMDMEYD